MEGLNYSMSPHWYVVVFGIERNGCILVTPAIFLFFFSTILRFTRHASTLTLHVFVFFKDVKNRETLWHQLSSKSSVLLGL